MGGVRGFSSLEHVLMHALDAAALRQRVTANNIANVNTPGFRRSFVRFEDELQRATDRQRLRGYITHERHIPVGNPRLGDVRPRVERDDATTMRNDGNNVDIDREMALNAAAELQYLALVQASNARYKQLRLAMK